MHIQVADVQAWLDPVKAQVTSLDPTLEANVSGYALGRLSQTFNNSTFGVPLWVDFNSTPLLVKQAIAMLYAAWVYDRQYSEIVAPSAVNVSKTGHPILGTPYGVLLRSSAESLLDGIVSGSILIQEIQPNVPDVAPVFYPTDASSTQDAIDSNTDTDDNSLGPSLFGVSKIF